MNEIFGLIICIVGGICMLSLSMSGFFLSINNDKLFELTIKITQISMSVGILIIGIYGLAWFFTK